MSVMTFKSEEFKQLPIIMREYASHLATIKGNSEKTVCEYLLDLRTFFRFLIVQNQRLTLTDKEFEKLGISEIGLSDIESVKQQTIIDFLMYAGFDRENTTTTRMRKLSALKSFFKYICHKRNLIEIDPTAYVDAPKKSRTLPKYLTVEEAVRLLTAVRSDNLSKTVERDYTMIALFLNTGLRLSELVGLNIESFDPDLFSMRVIGKGNKERVIYLNDAAKEAIRSYLNTRLDPRYVSTSDRAFFLSKRQTRISAKTVQWVVYKYLNLAGLGGKGLSVHKLRHTAATLMYQSGRVDIRVLKDILGHEQLNTTQIYTHVVDRNLEEAMQNNPLSDVIIKKPRRES